MLKLVVNPGTDQAWEIPLAEGVTTLGSDPASEFVIAHDTVSPAHCEISVTHGAAAIKDLGSAGGTFINAEPVSGGALKPGQTLRLGGVTLQLVSNTSGSGDPPVARPIPISMAAGAAAAPALACKYHPRAAARWHCGHCGAHFCDLCVNTRRVGETARHLCRKCGNDCAPVAVQYTAKEEKSFFEQLPGAFSFPFKGDGGILLVAGTVFFTAIEFMERYAGVFGLVLGIFVAGYLFSYTKQIVATTAQGSDVPPDWPDFGDWNEEIWQPFWQMLALMVLTLGPGLVLRWWHPFGDEHADLARYVALVLGTFFVPIGILALAMFDHVGALNPAVLIPSILRMPGDYLVAAAAFEFSIGSYVAAGVLIKHAGVPVLLAGLVLGFLNLYMLTAGARIVGLLYRTNQERLGWHGR